MTKPVDLRGDRQWDVIVVGGGTAGVAAAISAARGGASTLLVERSDVLGGNATQAFVHTFCGLFLPPTGPAAEMRYANPGFAERLSRWLMPRGGASAPEIHGKVGVLPTFPAKLNKLLLEACQAVPYLEVALATSLEEVQPLKGGNGFSLILSHALRDFPCRASFVIDTSGDARVASAAGVPLEVSPPEELQHPTFVFRVSGANAKDLEGYSRLKLSALFSRGARSGELPPECDSVLVRPTGTPSEAFISLNMPKPSEITYNPLDDKCLEVLESTAKARAGELVRFLRSHVPGWETCEVLEWPRRLGIRETRRIRGIYLMTVEDILEGHAFEDQVAVSTWPIELWQKHTGAEFQYPTAPCQIPLRALISAGNSRVGMAGRCMSASHEALGALRVMGTAMATGEAIGIAAALAARSKSTLSEVTAAQVRSSREEINRLAGEQP